MKAISFKIFIVLIEIAIPLLILELGARFFLPPRQSVVIDNLDKNLAQTEQTKLEVEGKPDAALFIGTDTGPRLKKNVKAVIKNHYLSHQDVEVVTNSQGYRYNELKPKVANDYRILVLGDSITLGDYVPADQTYPGFLEKKLKGEKNIQVINAGVSAIGSETELAILYETGLSIRPDVVLVGLFLNDASDSLMFKISKPPKILSQSRLLGYIMDKISLRQAANQYQLIQAQPKQEAEAFLSNHPISDPYNKLIYENFWDWGYAYSDKSWTKFEQIFKLFADSAKDNNFKLVVAMLPVKYQVESETPHDEPQKKFDKLMTKLNIDHIDLLPSLREKYQASAGAIYYDHAHYTAEGNEFVAGILYKNLSSFLRKQESN